MDLLNAEFLKHNIEIKKEFGSLRLDIRGDKKQLKQVFLNIFLNSIEAMPDEGIITIGTEEKGGNILTSIADTGPGIPKQNLNRIFDPFFTTKETGTGLGLSIANGIIREHHGKIEIVSRPGAKTTVKIYLRK